MESLSMKLGRATMRRNSRKLFIPRYRQRITHYNPLKSPIFSFSFFPPRIRRLRDRAALTPIFPISEQQSAKLARE